MAEEHRSPNPGVSREDRLSDEGLERLRSQLERGMRIARPVLQQWVQCYGDDARRMLEEHGYHIED